MKTKTFFRLLFSLVFIAGAKAQVITQVSLGSNIVSVTHNENGYIGASIKDYNLDDASLKIFDENGNQLGPERNFPAYYGGGSPAAVTGNTAIKNENDFLADGQVSARISGTYNAIRKYTSGTNPVLEKIFYNVVVKSFVFDGEYFAFAKTLSDSDFLNTGWNISYDGSQEDWHIVKLDNNLNIVWDYDIPYSFGHPHFLAPKLVQATPDGKMAIQMRKKGADAPEKSRLIKIDPANGNFLGIIAEGNDLDDVYIFEGGDLFFYKADVKVAQRLPYSSSGGPTPLPGVSFTETKWYINGVSHNFWERSPWDIKIISNEVRVMFSDAVGYLSEDFVHQTRFRFTSLYTHNGQGRWMNSDGTVGYVIENSGNYTLYKEQIPQPDPTMIPGINQNYPHLSSIHFGKKLDKNGNMINGCEYEVVLGWENGFVPQVGDPVPSGLFTDPQNPDGHFQIALPFDDLMDGNITIRGIVFDNNDSLHQTNLLAYCTAESSLGVSDNTLQNFSIYPNPVNDILHIKTDKKVDRVTIFDCNGRKVLEGSEKILNVGNLPTGIYFVRIFSEGKIAIKKLSVW